MKITPYNLKNILYQNQHITLMQNGLWSSLKNIFEKIANFFRNCCCHKRAPEISSDIKIERPPTVAQPLGSAAIPARLVPRGNAPNPELVRINNQVLEGEARRRAARQQ